MRTLRRFAVVATPLSLLALAVACGSTDVGDGPSVPALDSGTGEGGARQDASTDGGGTQDGGPDAASDGGGQVDAGDGGPGEAGAVDGGPGPGDGGAIDAGPVTYTVGGAVTGLDVDGLVLTNNGADDLALAAGVASFTFPTRVASGGAYAVAVKTQPAQRVCTVTGGAGAVGAANVTRVAVDCGVPTTCKTLKARAPAAPSGLYRVDPDGAGGVAPFTAYCDMDFDGGGWTLVVSTAGGLGPAGLAEGEVTVGDAKYLPPATLTALATVSSQVHLRSTGAAATESITSVADSEPIVNLRQLKVANEGLQGLTAAEQTARWTGPFAIPERLGFGCATSSSGYPSVYWACGNSQGLHLVTTNSRWNWLGGDVGQNQSLETYVR